ncbi:hypothetical protein U2F10_18565 [Leptothoe sp. EHU-05/26/07-4]
MTTPSYWQRVSSCLSLEISHQPLQKRFLALDTDTQELLTTFWEIIALLTGLGHQGHMPLSESIERLFQSMEAGEAPAIKQWVMTPQVGEVGSWT